MQPCNAVGGDSIGVIRGPASIPSNVVDSATDRACPSIVIEGMHESVSIVPTTDNFATDRMLPLHDASSDSHNVSVDATSCALGGVSSPLAATSISSPTQQISSVSISPDLEVGVVITDIFVVVSNTMNVSASNILQPMQAGTKFVVRSEPTDTNGAIPSSTNVHPMITRSKLGVFKPKMFSLVSTIEESTHVNAQ
ncbi:hypothetical protein V6N12_048944 [Hibiscus sabdariffa]|uniref:Uncharacterized protein n=1 Tax=Hibiscus sabdariffa TaxID=183260 RepID=A0ABR2EK96_9ROSI